MKIAIASDIYYPQINGVAVFAHNLANGLAKAGHEVIVIAPSFNGKYHVLEGLISPLDGKSKPII